MFESAELGHEVSKSEYEREVPALREALLEAQYDLLEKRSSATLDPHRWGRRRRQGRDGEPAQRVDGSAARPHARARRAHRRGARAPHALALLAGPAAQGQGRHLLRLLVHAAHRRRVSTAARATPELDQAVDQIVRFERMLSGRAGVVLVKLWFHLSKEQQRERLEALSKPTRRRAGA
jgi:hypothetical protein